MSIAECSEARKHSRSSGDLLDEEADGKDLKEKTNKNRLAYQSVVHPWSPSPPVGLNTTLRYSGASVRII